MGKTCTLSRRGPAKPQPDSVRRALRHVADPLVRRWLARLLLRGERVTSPQKGGPA